MATKKVTAKAATKKTIAKKTVAKTVASKPKRAKKIAKPQSFHVFKDNTPFMTFKITEQTAYWLILLVLIFGLSLWVLNIQINTNILLDSITNL